MGKITGMMEFDEFGRRRGFKVNIFDFRRPKPVKLASWTPETRVNLKENKEELEMYLSKSIQEKLFRITTRIVRNVN